jgi:hypothetical protein
VLAANYYMDSWLLFDRVVARLALRPVNAFERRRVSTAGNMTALLSLFLGSQPVNAFPRRRWGKLKQRMKPES